MTYQTKLVLNAARQMKHATNADILINVSKDIPEISATTVHRITARLVKNGILRYGPEINGSRIIDSNTKIHDHFVCKECVGIKDICLDEHARKQIKNQIPNLSDSTSLTITGNCNNCGKLS